MLPIHQKNLPEGTCRGDILFDIEVDVDKIPKPIKTIVKRCVSSNIWLDPDCDCAIGELAYWHWCREHLGSELLGGVGDWFGGMVGEAADEVLIRTVIKPRERFLNRRIDEHGYFCRLQAKGAGSAISSLQAVDDSLMASSSISYSR